MNWKWLLKALTIKGKLFTEIAKTENNKFNKYKYWLKNNLKHQLIKKIDKFNNKLILNW